MNLKLIRSTRVRVYTILAIIIILVVVVPFIHTKTNPSLNDESSENKIYIPEEHYNNRYDYLSLEEAEISWEQNQAYFSGIIKNNSYIYDLENVELKIYLYEDREAKILDETYFVNITRIPSRDHYEVKKPIELSKNEPYSWQGQFFGTKLVKKQ